jgi:hypothetical protein
LGIGSALITVVAAILVLTGRHDWPSEAAVVLTAAHSFTTTRAAPINVSQRHAAGDRTQLEAIFHLRRIRVVVEVRAAVQVLTLVFVASNIAGRCRFSESGAAEGADTRL